MPALPKAARIKNTVKAKKTTTKALLVVSVFISSNTPFFFISVIISRCILKISLCKREHPSRRGGGILIFRKSPVPRLIASGHPLFKGGFQKEYSPFQKSEFCCRLWFSYCFAGREIYNVLYDKGHFYLCLVIVLYKFLFYIRQNNPCLLWLLIIKNK